MSINNLPDIHFCDTDAGNIEQSVITTYEAIANVSLFPGDPVRLFLEGLAAIIIQQRQLIDYTGKQNLLKYAEGDNLVNLGAFTKTEKLPAAPANTVERFSMGSALGFVVSIPRGTRVSPDGQLFFETKNHGEIAVGDTHVDIVVQCQTEGAIGNGFVPGQITKIVDPVAYIDSVANIETSTGGADLEEDESYRERIHTAPESFSVAGPSGAYEHWAKSAHQDIVDICVDSPEDASIIVTPLLKGGGIPGQSILDLVVGILNDRTVRPLTDKVTVAAPGVAPYAIEMTYYVSSLDRLVATEIQANVGRAVADFIAWQKEKLGRDINPDKLTALVIGAGAKRIILSSPVNASVAINQVAIQESVTVNYGGLEDE